MDRTMLNRSPAELIAMATGRRGAAGYADAHKLIEKIVIGRFKTSHSWALQNQQRCECSVSALKLVFRTRGIAARLCFSGS